MPAEPSARVVRIDPLPGNALCSRQTSTRSGDLVVNTSSDSGAGYRWGFYDRDGRLKSAFLLPEPGSIAIPLGTNVGTASNVTVLPDASHLGRVIYGWAAFGPDGFSAFVEQPAEPGWQLGAGAVGVLPDPAVGVITAITEQNVSDTVRPQWRVTMWTFDERAALCAAPWVAASGLGQGPLPFVAVDDLGRILLMLDWEWNPILAAPGARIAQWFEQSGRPDSVPFDAQVGHASCGSLPCEDAQWKLMPLIGGGAAFVEGQQYLAVFPSAEPRFEPAPDWLAGENGSRMFRVGSSRGYAFIPWVTQNGECADRIHFVSTDGQSCGTALLDAVYPCGSVVNVGRDGTVIQQTGDFLSSPHACDLAVWDRYLAE